MKTCRRCGQQIRWVFTARGGSIALAGDACPDGQISVHRAPSGHLYARHADTEYAGDRYQLHRAVCPAGRS